MNDFNAWAFASTWYLTQSTIIITDILFKFLCHQTIYKPHIFGKVIMLSTRLWIIKQNLWSVGIFRREKGKRYFTTEHCFNKMYIANNVRRECRFVYDFIFVLSITYYSRNPVDDCSAYYPVAKMCQKSKWNDPFIYDPFSVMRVMHCSKISMCKSITIVLYKYQLKTVLWC